MNNINRSCGNCLLRAFALCGVLFTQQLTGPIYRWKLGSLEAGTQVGIKTKNLDLGLGCFFLRTLIILHHDGQTLLSVHCCGLHIWNVPKTMCVPCYVCLMS